MKEELGLSGIGCRSQERILHWCRRIMPMEDDNWRKKCLVIEEKNLKEVMGRTEGLFQNCGPFEGDTEGLQLVV